MAKTKKSGFLSTIIGFILGVIIAVSFMTCPNKQQHMDKLKSVMYEKTENNSNCNALVKYIGKMFVDQTLEDCFSMRNYIFFSVGHIKSGSNDKIVTVGAFNHVFLTNDTKDNE